MTWRPMARPSAIIQEPMGQTDLTITIVIIITMIYIYTLNCGPWRRSALQKDCNNNCIWIAYP